MTEKELTDKLKEQFKASDSVFVAMPDDGRGIVAKGVNVFVTDEATNRAVCMNVQYYVVDGGKPTEAAYWYDGNLTFDPGSVK